MDREKLLKGLTTVLLLAIVFLLGLSYAYYKTRVVPNKKTKSISAISKKLEVIYADGNGIIEPSGVISPGWSTTKTFTVENTGDETVEYAIVFDRITNTFTRPDWIYRLTKNGESEPVASGTISSWDSQHVISTSIGSKTTDSYSLYVEYKNLTDVDQSDDMGSNISLRVNIASVDSVDLLSNTSTLAYNIINNAKNSANGTTYRQTPLTIPAEQTTMYYAKGEEPTSYTKTLSNATNYYVSYASDYSVNPTTGKLSLVNPTIATSKYTTSMANDIVGKYVVIATTEEETQNLDTIYKVSPNISDVTTNIKYAKIDSSSSVQVSEASLSETEDDYGTSYYFRGTTEDNYVTFANMCWRIVRIEGDGSIKLILEDQDEVCSGAMNGNWDIPTETGGSTKLGNFGYTYYEQETLTASDGTTTNSGYIHIKNYLNGQTNSDKSMAYAFQNFQINQISSYLDKLKVDNWCYDDKGYNGGNGINITELTSSEILDRKIQQNSVYYDSYVRLYGKIPKESTLKCNGTIMNKFGDNTTDMYVATLTADEIVYAGGKAYKDNQNYYLINDYQKTFSLCFWTLSPFRYLTRLDYIFSIHNNGNVYSNFVSKDFSFRPAVTLKASTTISGGNGTIDSPYVIN